MLRILSSIRQFASGVDQNLSSSYKKYTASLRSNDAASTVAPSINTISTSPAGQSNSFMLKLPITTTDMMQHAPHQNEHLQRRKTTGSFAIVMSKGSTHYIAHATLNTNGYHITHICPAYKVYCNEIGGMKVAVVKVSIPAVSGYRETQFWIFQSQKDMQKFLAVIELARATPNRFSRY